MVLAAGIGADLALPPDGEAPAGCSARTRGAICSPPRRRREDAVLEAARRDGGLARAVGTTGGAALTLAGGDAISMGELIRAHEDWLPGLMAVRG